MKNKHLLFILLCTTGLFACTNQATQVVGSTTKFVPEIKPNNLKLFTYTIVEPAKQRKSQPAYREKELARGTKSLEKTRNKRNPKIAQERREQEVTASLEAELAKNGFCQGGHTIINSYFERGNSGIKGQCNDRATQADRGKFPNAVSTQAATEFNTLEDTLILETPK